MIFPLGSNHWLGIALTETTIKLAVLPVFLVEISTGLGGWGGRGLALDPAVEPGLEMAASTPCVPLEIFMLSWNRSQVRLACLSLWSCSNAVVKEECGRDPASCLSHFKALWIPRLKIIALILDLACVKNFFFILGGVLLCCPGNFLPTLLEHPLFGNRRM